MKCQELFLFGVSVAATQNLTSLVSQFAVREPVRCADDAVPWAVKHLNQRGSKWMVEPNLNSTRIFGSIVIICNYSTQIGGLHMTWLHMVAQCVS